MKIRPFLLGLVGLAQVAITSLSSDIVAAAQPSDKPVPTPPTLPEQKSTQYTVITVTDSTFKEQVLDSKIPVVVFFTTPWCVNCSMVESTFPILAERYQGRAKITRVNLDDNVNAAAQSGVRVRPTVLIFKQGQVVERMEGSPNIEQVDLPSVTQALERQL